MFRYKFNFSVGGKSYASSNSEPETSEKYKNFCTADYISTKNDEYISDFREIITEEEEAILSTEKQQANNSRNITEEKYVTLLSLFSVDEEFLKTTKAIVQHKYTMVQLMRLSIYTENEPFPSEIISLKPDGKYNASINIQDIYATDTTLTECLQKDVLDELMNRSSDENRTGYFSITSDTKIIAKLHSNSHKNMMEDSSNEMLYTSLEMTIHCQPRSEILLKRILLVERIGQYVNAIDNNSKNRGKLSIRLNVITSDVFRDAMRNYRRSTYVLTYSRFFPSNCRMFIEIPINNKGYIGRLEEKERLCN